MGLRSALAAAALARRSGSAPLRSASSAAMCPSGPTRPPSPSATSTAARRTSPSPTRARTTSRSCSGMASVSSPPATPVLGRRRSPALWSSAGSTRMPSTDLAVASVGDDNIAIRLGDGTGGFTRHGHGLDRGRTVIRARIAIGDFNNDNKTDLISANQGSSTVSILLGDGMGGFADGYRAPFRRGHRSGRESGRDRGRSSWAGTTRHARPEPRRRDRQPDATIRFSRCSATAPARSRAGHATTPRAWIPGADPSGDRRRQPEPGEFEPRLSPPSPTC